MAGRGHWVTRDIPVLSVGTYRDVGDFCPVVNLALFNLGRHTFGLLVRGEVRVDDAQSVVAQATKLPIRVGYAYTLRALHIIHHEVMQHSWSIDSPGTRKQVALEIAPDDLHVDLDCAGHVPRQRSEGAHDALGHSAIGTMVERVGQFSASEAQYEDALIQLRLAVAPGVIDTSGGLLEQLESCNNAHARIGCMDEDTVNSRDLMLRQVDHYLLVPIEDACEPGDRFLSAQQNAARNPRLQ